MTRHTIRLLDPLAHRVYCRLLHTKHSSRAVGRRRRLSARLSGHCTALAISQQGTSKVATCKRINAYPRHQCRCELNSRVWDRSMELRKGSGVVVVTNRAELYEGETVTW